MLAKDRQITRLGISLYSSGLISVAGQNERSIADIQGNQIIECQTAEF